MKIKSLYIENFQSIKQLKLDFRENEFIGIMGENNVGKTAIIRALNLLATATDTRYVKRHFLRKGEKNLKIILETYNGDKITLVRGKDNYYLIEDAQGNIEEYQTNALQKVPDRVAEILDFFIDINTKQTYNIVIGSHNLPLFNSTPSSNYRLLQMVLKTEEVDEALEKMKEDLAIVTAETNNTHLAIQTTKQTIQELEKSTEDNEQLKEKLNRLVTYKEILDLCYNFDKNYKQRELLKDSIRDVTYQRKLLDGLVEKIQTTASLENYIMKLKELQQLKQEYKKDILQIREGLTDKLEVAVKLEEYINKTKDKTNLNKQIVAINKPKVDIESLEKLETLINKYRELINYKKLYISLQEEVSKYTNEKREILKTIGYCPYCNTQTK